MRKIFLLSVIGMIYQYSVAQNMSYQLFEMEIFPISETDYVKAKELFEENRNQYAYDPANTFLFLAYTLKNDDIKFFKSEVIELIKKYGYSYSPLDTSGIAMLNVTNQQIYEKGLSEWLVKMSNRHHHKWVQSHPESELFSNLVNKLFSRDQLSRSIHPNIPNGDCLDSWLVAYDSILAAFDIQNIIDIQDLCIKNNFRMVNNFENGFGIWGKIQFIIFHNLKQGTNILEVWNRLSPYIENAYVDGVIPEDLFTTYDYYLHLHQGVQYYGTLGESIEILDKGNYEARKVKLKL